MKFKSEFKILLAVLIISATIFSCKKDSIIPTSASFNYFPIEQGTYTIFDVDSIYHADNDNNNDDSVYSWHYQVKEVIDSTFEDGQGRPTQIIYRYKRSDALQSWMLTNVWTQTLTKSAAWRYEDNVVYHKLAFPINKNIEWNGNDANESAEEIYSYEAIHDEMDLGTLTFDSTISVLQVDENNYVEKIYGYEIYANNAGLIYKERADLRKINGLVTDGTEYKMSLIEFGIE